MLPKQMCYHSSLQMTFVALEVAQAKAFKVKKSNEITL